MRYIAIALTCCFLMTPLVEAKTRQSHVAKVKKHKVKGRKAPKHRKTV